MIVLHSVWRPGGEGLAIWGEGGETIRGRRSKKTPRHAFAVEGGPLREIWRELGGSSDADPSAILRLLLPTSGGQPLPSPERARMGNGAEPPDAGEATLAEWTVPAVAAPPAAALHWLAQLPRDPHPTPNLAFAADLRFWAEAARLALELLARQRFVPTVAAGEDQFTARWEPLWDDPADARRLKQMVEAMPPAGRAALDPAGPRDARELLEQFFRQCLDAAIRDWCAPSASSPTSAPSTGGQDTDRWLAALAAPQPALAGGRALLRRLARRVQEWTGRLQTRTTAGFRTCFQLEPPGDPPEGVSPRKARSASAEEKWQLTFWLQALDDPSLRVSAAQIWELGEKPLRLLNRRFENPQERLLEDLGRACRVFSPLAGSLRAARPEALPLGLSDAYQFLREATPLLEESGYGVLVPSWWNKPAGRLSLRLRVRPARRGSRRSTGAGLGMENLVQFDWQASLGGETLTREEFERLAALKTPLVNVRGQWVELRPEDLEATLRAWESRSQGELATLAQALHAQAEAVAHGVAVEAVEAEGWLQALIDGDGQDRLEPLPPPEGFTGTLRPYQLGGYSWLSFLRRWGLGACLADDMGLGKTPQCLAALLRRREEMEGAAGPTLLVCPTSVAENWRREAARFAPALRVLLHHGPGRARGDEFLAEVAGHDLVVTTYALIQRDLESLRQVDWDTIALDEAQNIKNPEAKQTRAVRSLQAGWRVALSGTPVENRLRELWSIMEFLNPSYLGPEATFHRRFAIPIERYGDEAQSTTLRRLIHPFVLRRVKTDPKVIQDLPDKVEQKVFCPLTPEQATLYEAVVRDMLQRLEAAEGMERRGLVLATLMKLKQVCNHPAHFLGDAGALPGRSGKLNRLEELLEEALAVGDRALLFSQFTEMGERLQRHLRQRFGVEVLFLHGGVPRPKRDRMVAHFQEAGGPPVMVLSLKAGGVGLNLTRANQVFHFDRWWNPAVENQATDRAFRIGQHRNVLVHKFVCTGTVEERIDALIESKLALAESIVGAGESWITELSPAELRELFTLRREAVAVEE